MNEAGPAAALDPGVAIERLRERGAHRCDPVRFRFIEALARRAAAHEGEVRRLLDARPACLLAEYGKQHEKACAEAADTFNRLAAEYPDAAAELGLLQRGGDFPGLRRLAARLQGQGRRGALADLVGPRVRSSPADGEGGPADEAVASGPDAPVELKAVQQFRGTWARLGAEQQLQRSLAKAPDNAGPLNSQLLVLRSLKLMRDIAPAYLQHFMSYADALLWLDQAQQGVAPAPANPVRGEGRKRKPARSRSG
jgi:hypothetical protein